MAVVNVAVVVMVIMTMRRSYLHNDLRISQRWHRCKSKKYA
jgi:hypothetical protein